MMSADANGWTGAAIRARDDAKTERLGDERNAARRRSLWVAATTAARFVARPSPGIQPAFGPAPCVRRCCRLPRLDRRSRRGAWNRACTRPLSRSSKVSDRPVADLRAIGKRSFQDSQTRSTPQVPGRVKCEGVQYSIGSPGSATLPWIYAVVSPWIGTLVDVAYVDRKSRAAIASPCPA